MLPVLRNFFKFHRSVYNSKSLYCKKSNEYSKEYIESLYNEWSDYLEKDSKVLEKVVIESQPKIYTRGKTGVFDLEEIVELLKEEYVNNIFCVKVPNEMQYADYLVIGSCKAKRHLLTTMNSINKIYKKKKSTRDPFLTVEGGETNSDWLALDMSNIVLHLFLPETRKLYDLESLWSVGIDYDDHYKKQEKFKSKPQGFEIDWEAVAKKAFEKKEK